jgi:hypothetical protein
MSECDPIEEQEYVYRRILRQYYQSNLAIPVQREAFRPTQSDLTGVSVFRARFARPEDTLVNVKPDRIRDYYVCQLPVRELRPLGLSVVPEPIPGGPAGHAIIPELAWVTYQARKSHWKQVLLELARLAARSIVIQAS